MGRCDAAGVILFCVYALILFCNRSITCTIKPGNADHRFFSKVVERLAQTVNHLFQQCKDPAAKAFCPRCFPNLFNTQTLVPLQGFASDRASCRFPDSSTVKPTSYPSKRRTTKGSLWRIIAAACFLADQTGRELVESVSGDAVSSGSSNQKVSFTRPFLPAPSSTVREFDKQKCLIELTKSSPESIIIKYGSMPEG